MREADLSCPLGRAGFELSTKKHSQAPTSKELSSILPCTPETERVQNPVHVDTSSEDTSSELTEIIEAWSELPEHIKQTIMTLLGSVAVISEEISP